jgi:hypothetical protein
LALRSGLRIIHVLFDYGEIPPFFKQNPIENVWYMTWDYFKAGSAAIWSLGERQ